MPRILAASDWHLDASTAGVDRFDDTAGAVDASVEAAIDLQVDTYLFGGDLTDPNNVRSLRATTTIIQAFRRLIAKGIQPVAVAGNHDVIEDGGRFTTLSPLNAACPEALVAELPSMRTLKNGSLLIALPFTSTAYAYDPAEFIARCAGLLDASNRGLPTIIAGHLNLEGISPGSETLDMPRGRDVFWPMEAIAEHFPHALCVGGHYHAPQEYGGVHIIGSLARLRFDECSNETGYVVLEF